MRLWNMKKIRLGSFLCLGFYLVTLISCSTYQPIKPRVMLHPTEYQNAVTYEGISVAAIPFNSQRSMYVDPKDTNPSKPVYNLLEAGVCPVRLIFFNGSNEAVFVDPIQITCRGTNGIVYQPFNEPEAGDTIVASQAFRSWVKGAFTGAVVGALIGTALGAAIGGAIGGRDYARNGAVIGGITGGASGAAEGGLAFQMQMERQIRMTLAMDHLKQMTLSPGVRHEGVILCPAVPLQVMEILLEDPKYQWSQLIEVPIVVPGSGPRP
jgi:hypothetical protein